MATALSAVAAGVVRGRPEAFFAARGVFAGARGLGRSGADFWRFAVVLMSEEELTSAALRFEGAPWTKDSAAGKPLPGRGTLTMLIGAMMKM